MTHIDPSLAINGGLRRGVNLSHWYSQVYSAEGYTTRHFNEYLTTADFQLIADMGFDHVRFPISWEWLFSGSLSPNEAMDRIADAVTRLQAVGLSVIVDAHPEMDFKRTLGSSDAAAAKFVSEWEELAARLRHLPTTQTAFEILNEPSIGNASRWHSIARDALEAVRSHCPEHLVILSGDGYSEIPQLLELPDFDDPAIVYNFHLYDPMILSHQSAYFADDWVKAVGGLAYPTTAENVEEVLSNPDLPGRTVAELVDYRELPWDLSRYESHIEEAVEFARTRGVALTCNEFGIYREAPSETRVAWLGDVSRVLSAAGVGYSVWDYAGDFAVAPGVPGHRIPEREIIRAMGLPARASLLSGR